MFLVPFLSAWSVLQHLLLSDCVFFLCVLRLLRGRWTGGFPCWPQSESRKHWCWGAYGDGRPALWDEGEGHNHRYKYLLTNLYILNLFPARLSLLILVFCVCRRYARRLLSCLLSLLWRATPSEPWDPTTLWVLLRHRQYCHLLRDDDI